MIRDMGCATALITQAIHFESGAELVTRRRVRVQSTANRYLTVVQV